MAEHYSVEIRRQLDEIIDGISGISGGGGAGGDVTIVAPIPAGDNNIGNVDIVTMPNVVVSTLPTVTITALPSGTNNIGDIDVLTLPALPTGTNNIGFIGVTKRNITPLVGTVASSGSNTIVAQPGAGSSIRVLSWKIWNESTTPIKAILKTATVNVDAYFMFTQGAGWIDKLDTDHAILLGLNEALVIDLSAAGTVGYSIRYEII